ncbi:MAG: hypothetical protein ABF289_08770 [Clostridiales bacterium]
MAQGRLEYYISLANEGTRVSIKKIMNELNRNMTLIDSKLIDFTLGNVINEDGIEIMKEYLFKGTQIQRNYCTLYFIRRGEYLIVRKAYGEGLIDAKQAFSR